MDEHELRAALNLLVADRDFADCEMDRETMQEELIHWLLAEGLSLRHEFLLYREQKEQSANAGGEVEQEQQQIWLLGKRTKGCQCCEETGPGRSTPTMLSACPSPVPTPRRSGSPQPPAHYYTTSSSSAAAFASPLPIDHRHHPPCSSSRSASPNPAARKVQTAPAGLSVSGANASSARASPAMGRRVITDQPMPWDKNSATRRALEEQAQRKKKSRAEDCCVECGHFCVDLISTLK